MEPFSSATLFLAVCQQLLRKGKKRIASTTIQQKSNCLPLVWPICSLASFPEVKPTETNQFVTEQLFTWKAEAGAVCRRTPAVPTGAAGKQPLRWDRDLGACWAIGNWRKTVRIPRAIQLFRTYILHISCDISCGMFCFLICSAFRMLSPLITPMPFASSYCH